jgi:hypothetical protein
VQRELFLCFHGNTKWFYIVDSYMWVNNMKGTYCVSMVTVVTQTQQCYAMCTLPILFILNFIAWGYWRYVNHVLYTQDCVNWVGLSLYLWVQVCFVMSLLWTGNSKSQRWRYVLCLVFMTGLIWTVCDATCVGNFGLPAHPWSTIRLDNGEYTAFLFQLK